MVKLLATFIATMVTMPILAIFVVYWLSYIVTKDKKRSFRLSVDLSTVFFIIAVHYLVIIIWGNSYLWVILLLLIMIGMLFVFLQWKYNEEIIFRKVWKGFWRFNFLLFSLGYLSLVIYGLVLRLKDI
ncbi:DUF3397 domain-containing protein [Calidifontibacillus oryziterrae]|uniref:DUF3397 domain-containing protein n=1 Tax=Calidifontibacillus oryziterrae TaxID=1191699 RepID=UPI0002E16CD5|nr:DUF3397 domain-containing protein [Calidifontibacillus oryziterrae]